MTAVRTGLFLITLAGAALAQTTPPSSKPAQTSAQGPAAARQATDTQAKPPDTAKPATGAATTSGAFSNEQLEQLVAPIALYPDSLVAQIFMAATYPLEIVEAARWQAKNPKLKEKELEAALQKQTWDPSVKSLCGFAEVLKRMNDNLDWTQDLGDAFLGQKAELMAAVQTMRRKALEAGNLKSSKELTVTEQPPQVIIIEAADPEVIYVPTYYPTAAYGSWGYPYWYYPPLYPPAPAGGFFWGFTAGVIWGGAIWGDCDWNHNDIDIDIDRQNNFIDRTESGDRRQQVKDKRGSSSNFKHDPSHRKGVGYKDSKVAQNFGGSPGQSRVSRDQARGYGDRSGTRPSSGSTRDVGGTRPSATPRPSTGAAASQRPSTASASSRSTRPSTGQSSGSFSGSRSPSFDRASSSRGSASRSSAGSRSMGGSRGGGRGGGRR